MSDETNESRRRIERAARRARKKRRLILLILGGVLLGALVLGATPTYRLFKVRRADKFAAEADQLVRDGKLDEAAAKYRAALQLDKQGYRPLSGAARLATRLGRPEGEDIWEQVMRLPQRTAADRQEYVSLLLQRNRFKIAGDQIQELLRVQPDARTLMLAARLKHRTGDVGRAIEFARAAVAMTPREEEARFQLADVLASSTDTAHRAEARSILWDFGQGEGPFRTEALEALARAPELTAEERERLLGTFEALPNPSPENAVFTAELRLQLRPAEAEKIYDEISARLGGGDTRAVTELARWLNLHKQYNRVLTVVAEERASGSADLLISRLDALAGLERWTDIDATLASPQLALAPAIIESFRARASQARNDMLDATLHWNNAVAAAGADPEQLQFVGNFAEQGRADDVAFKCYEQLSRYPEHAGVAFRGLQRLADKRGDSLALRSISDKLASVAPDDADARNQSAYMNLLLNTDVQKNAATAKELVENHPTRLAFHITAALAALRQQNASAALAQFAGSEIEWRRTPPAWRAVYAATLLANDQRDKAQTIIAMIDLAKLKAEERELLEQEK